MAFVALLLTLVCRQYVLSVYAPGLEAEAREVPALVQSQVARNGGAYVPFDAISPDLRDAIVAIEDRRFYTHHGVDLQAILRAVLVNTVNRHVDEGGSTLEEQLAKLTIVHSDAALRSKLRTMALAWAIDQEFSKQQVLELYLNEAYYGEGAYGVAAAAHIYFGTSPASLSLPESAFLAALPQAPSVYGAHPTDPIVTSRVKTVLQDMQELGYITATQKQQADVTPLHFAFPNP